MAFSQYEILEEFVDASRTSFDYSSFAESVIEVMFLKRLASAKAYRDDEHNKARQKRRREMPIQRVKDRARNYLYREENKDIILAKNRERYKDPDTKARIKEYESRPNRVKAKRAADKAWKRTDKGRLANERYNEKRRIASAKKREEAERSRQNSESVSGTGRAEASGDS